MENGTIARRLLEFAEYLDSQEANVYRQRAYRRAAETVLRLEQPVATLVQQRGRAGLEELPGIGPHLSYTIDGLVRTGEFRTLNPRYSEVDAERLFASLPGIGPHLARQIHEQIHIETLEQLEQAAHDGRLRELGLGTKRIRGLMDALAGRLGRQRIRESAEREPEITELLAIDQEYRAQAQTEQLPTIAPRRFNPELDPWLPLMIVERSGWRYRVLFSNTALAHRLGQTHDWVVVHFDDGQVAGQRTIVTETRGDLRGQRVVRGREHECRDHYRPLLPGMAG